jgi:hypothetical protein
MQDMMFIKINYGHMLGVEMSLESLWILDKVLYLRMDISIQLVENENKSNNKLNS